MSQVDSRTFSGVTIARLRPWRRMTAAAAVVAVADGIFAFIVYGPVTGAFNFETLQQFIASGLVGESAFATGWAGVGYAALGVAIHIGIAAAVTVFYAVTMAPRVRTASAAVAIGLAYGACFWLVMNAVILPLGRSGQEPFLSANYVAFLVEHALLVGLPIALIMRGAYWPSNSTGSNAKNEERS